MTKLDYYLAQLTAETRKSWVKNPNKVKASEFILRPTEQQEKMKRSKSIWMKALNVKPKKD